MTRRRQIGTGGALLVFGLLLWARLLLVTNHPRTAIAEPTDRGEQASAEPQEPGEDALAVRDETGQDR